MAMKDDWTSMKGSSLAKVISPLTDWKKYVLEEEKLGQCF